MVVGACRSVPLHAVLSVVAACVSNAHYFVRHPLVSPSLGWTGTFFDSSQVPIFLLRLSHLWSILMLMLVDPCIIVQFIKKNLTRCTNVLTFYYSVYLWSSTCFGRHTAHHQEPKVALAVWFFICGRLLDM